MEVRPRAMHAFLCSFILLAASASAQTIGVAAYQEGKDKDLKPEAFLNSLVSGCMDELFFSGYIATSDKVLSLSAAEYKQGAQIKLEAARQASIAYEVEILVSVSKSSFSKTLLIPNRAEYRFVDIKSGKILVQGALQGMEDGEDVQARIDAWCVRASKEIMPACLGKVAGVSQKVES